MTKEQFIKDLVEISYLEDHYAYGHYPFLMFVENIEGDTELHALMLGGSVEAVYKRVKMVRSEGAKKAFPEPGFPHYDGYSHRFCSCI